jgi:glucose-1-phosphate cytidylyltransferase
MKVVLFCGGKGLRLREYSENIPKPMVPIGYRPIIWHLMKYYAHYGHTDFILCLGHQADVIKQYFLTYEETISNDFVLRAGADGGRDLQLLGRDIDCWSIAFVDTGVDANIGQRLLAVREHLAGEEAFLANYADNLTDAPLPAMVEHFRRQDKVASFISVCPSQSFHIVRFNSDDYGVQQILPVQDCGVWINGGFFCFKSSVFDYIEGGEELVIEPFQRLIAARQLTTYPHAGFWACMDTFKERQTLEDLHVHGDAPWEVWKPRRSRNAECRMQNAESKKGAPGLFS